MAELTGWQAVAMEFDCRRILIGVGPEYQDWLPAEAAAKEILRLRQSKDAAYTERDRLVQALSKLFPSYLCRHPESDELWDADWRWIVVVQLPTGQASWHIHDSERGWFDHLEVRANQWDGHSTEEKYARLSRLPVRDERDEIERLRAEIQLLNTDRSIRDSEADGKRIAELMRVQAVKDAEVDRLKRERDEARATIQAYKDQTNSLLQKLSELTRERDEARAELAKGTVTMTATVDPKGRLDAFAKAALTGLLAGRAAHEGRSPMSREAAELAQATIRALDGAGGA